MIPKNYGFWRFLPPEFQGKIYQPQELATGVSVTFLKQDIVINICAKFHAFIIIYTILPKPGINSPHYFYSFLVTFYSLLVNFYSLLVTFYSLLVTFYSLLVTFYLLVVTFYSLLIATYLLLVTVCSVLITFYSCSIALYSQCSH